MPKFIPFDKMSKKQQREINSARRGSWGGVNPATRRSENPKAYSRSKSKRAAARNQEV